MLLFLCLCYIQFTFGTEIAVLGDVICCTSSKNVTFSLSPFNTDHIKYGPKTSVYISAPDLPDPSNFVLRESSMCDYRLDDCVPSSRPEMFRSLQDWNSWREDSESDMRMDPTLKIRKMEFEKRRRKKERQRRRQQEVNTFVTSTPPRKQSIHSFFPSLNESEDKSAMIHEESNEIPRLNLSDLTSEVTAPDMSLISEAFSLANSVNHQPDSGCCGAEVFNNPHQKTSRSIACDTLDLNNFPVHHPSSTQTTPGRLNTKVKDLVLNKSLPLLQDHEYNFNSMKPNVIIIKQQDPGEEKKQRKNKKKRKELKDLLKSLDSATLLAEKLKVRSENLLESVNSINVV